MSQPTPDGLNDSWPTNVVSVAPAKLPDAPKSISGTISHKH